MKHVMHIVFLLMAYTTYAQQDEITRLINYRRYTSAEQKAKEQLAQNNNGYNWFRLSQVYIASKDSTQLVQLQPVPATDPWAKIAMAAVKLQQQQPATARGLTEEAIGDGRKKDEALVKAAAFIHIYHNNGDKNYALELLDYAIKKDKRNPALYTMLGDAYFRMRNGSEAYLAYQKAADADPKYAPALFQMGKIFATQNNTELFFKYYNDAVNADPAFAPAWYELYYQTYATDKKQAYEYFKKYLAVTDISDDDHSQEVDMLYLTQQYNAAIQKGKQLLQSATVGNRMNKLLAYSYKGLNQPDTAISYITRYLAADPDTVFLEKDYQFVADLYEEKKLPDSAAAWYIRSADIIKDSSTLVKQYKKLSDYFKTKKDYQQQLRWAQLYYNTYSHATNVDLFNWGFAAFMAGQYQQADSVFGMYTQRYPEQVHGPYWQARANSAIDTTMTLGLAVPHYEQLIAIAEKDTTAALNKRYLKEAYGYLATYVANEKKDYQTAIDYFEKLLVFDPSNEDARRYIEILEKRTNSTNTKGADK